MSANLKSTTPIVFALLLALIIFCALPAAAGQDVLHVSFTRFPPWKIELEDGGYGGIDIELLKLVADRMDLELDIETYPWKRGLRMLETGEVDVVTSLLRRPDREKFAHFIEPPYVRQTNKAFYVLKGNERLVTRYENLANLRVGTFVGLKYFERFDNDQSLNKVPAREVDQIFDQLLQGRVETLIYTEAAGDFRLRQMGLEDEIVKAAYVYKKPQDVYFALSRKSMLAQRLDEFSRVLGDLVSEGAVERIKAQVLRETAFGQ